MTTLHEAAKQALDVLQSIFDLEDRPYDPFYERDLADLHWRALENLRDALGTVESTHSEECYQWHHACAIAEVKRLRAALVKPPRKIRASTCVFPQCVSTTRTTCDAWAAGACKEPA